MIQLQHIQNNYDEIISKLKIKGFNDEEIIKNLLALLNTRSNLTYKLETERHFLNKISKDISIFLKNEKNTDALKLDAITIKSNIDSLEKEINHINEQVNNLIVKIPNIPHDSVPNGTSSDDNTVIYQNANIPVGKTYKSHWELAGTHNIINWELGNKITGSGFPVYIEKGAKLQRALINFFLDEAELNGYNEIQVPILVNSNSAFCTGQLPDKDKQMYVTTDDLYLVPTAEVPLTNIYKNCIINDTELPIKICGYTPCFRREAGSYGKDVKGLNRLHQFDKVEIVQIVHPNESYAVLDSMREYVKSILDKLGLYYRCILLCGGDMSFSSAKTYDMEVWSFGQEKWLEVSSISNFETFQSNRLKLRIAQTNKNILAHTLNASALALPRIMAAIIEQYQQEDGTIQIPQILHKYLNFTSI